jgi:glutamate synthase domain-containing protein 2/CDGSH-type Zn-finger protein
MNKTVIADNKPAKIYLKKGQEYHFCTCGRSKSQPSCDGSHAGTDFTPRVIVADQDGENYLCACKQSNNLPFCDGSHTQIGDEMIGADGRELYSAKPTAPPPRATKEEPYVELIHQLAKEGLSKLGHHGFMGAMGVPRDQLPSWDDIQILTAQLATKPLMEDDEVATELIIGPYAQKPLKLSMPVFVSDMSFGALSQEAKVALSRGSELAGTGICSGEGGMLPEEKAENSHYFYELASAKFGYRDELMKDVQAFHFKGGQGAKTGTGGHLPGNKNRGKISIVRGIPEGEPAVSPPTFPDLAKVEDFRDFGDKVRELSGGIPIGFKISANHIEDDMAFVIEAGADYIILDGRGGGTGAAPLIFRDHISVPTIPALARARHYLDKTGNSGKITLIITGGLRMPMDFVKALALGADGVAISNSAMQAIGCVGARICNSNNCPAGIATQNPELRKRLDIDHAASNLTRFMASSVELMQVMARACGHRRLSDFNRNDLTTWHRKIAELTGIEYGGYSQER